MQQPVQATPLHPASMQEANQQLQPSSALVPWYAQHAPEAQRLRFATVQPSSSVDVPISTPPVSEAIQRRSSPAQQSNRVAAVMARHDSAGAAQFTPQEPGCAGTVNNGNAPFDSTTPAQASVGMARAYTATRKSSSDVGQNPFQLATTSTVSQRGASSARSGAGVSPFQQALKTAASHESGYNRPSNQVSISSSIGQTQQAPGVQIWPEHAVPALVTPGRSEQQQHRQDSMPVNHYIDISALTEASNHTLPTGLSNIYQQQPYTQQSMNSNGLITAQSASRSELAQQVPFYESSPQYTAVQAPVNRSLPAKALGIAKSYLNIRSTRPSVQQASDCIDGNNSNSPTSDLESAVPPSGCSPKSALLRSAVFPGGQGGSPIPPQQAERRARGLVRTRVEPKVFFANERTFLQWLQISVLLMFTGLSLLGGSSVGSMGGGGSEGACGQNGSTACKASKVEWTASHLLSINCYSAVPCMLHA